MNALELCQTEITRFLREPLVSRDGWERVARRGACLPSAFSAFYLECRLSPPGPELDLLAAVRWSEQSSELPLAPHEEGDAASTFVSRWLYGAVATNCPLIWVELDDGAPVGSRPFSNLHICLEKDYLTRAGGAEPEATAAEWAGGASVSRITAEMLHARLLTRAQLDRLQRVVACLPSGGRLVHVSAMAARLPMELKLYLALPGSSALGFLSSVLEPEWHSRLDALTPWLDARLHGSVVYCDLTFRGNASKGVGVVFSQPQIQELQQDAGRRAVRERLVREGLCTLSQDAALEAWTGEPLVQGLPSASGRALRRWLDLKVTLGPARLVSKAYLGFAPVPLLL